MSKIIINGRDYKLKDPVGHCSICGDWDVKTYYPGWEYYISWCKDCIEKGGS